MSLQILDNIMCSQKLHWSVFHFGFPQWFNRKPKHKIEEPIFWPPLPGIDPQTVAYIVTEKKNLVCHRWAQYKEKRATTSCVDACCDLLPVSRNRCHSEYASYVKLSAVFLWLCMYVCLYGVSLCIYSIHICTNYIFLNCVFNLVFYFSFVTVILFSSIAVLCCFVLSIFFNSCAHSIYLSSLISSELSKQGCTVHKPNTSLSQGGLQLDEFFFLFFFLSTASWKHQHNKNKVVGFVLYIVQTKGQKFRNIHTYSTVCIK